MRSLAQVRLVLAVLLLVPSCTHVERRLRIPFVLPVLYSYYPGQDGLQASLLDESTRAFDEGAEAYRASSYRVAAHRFLDCAAAIDEAERVGHTGPAANEGLRTSNRLIGYESAALSWIMVGAAAEAQRVRRTLASISSSESVNIRRLIETLANMKPDDRL